MDQRRGRPGDYRNLSHRPRRGSPAGPEPSSSGAAAAEEILVAENGRGIGIRFPVSGFRFPVSGFRFPVSGKNRNRWSVVSGRTKSEGSTDYRLPNSVALNPETGNRARSANQPTSQPANQPTNNQSIAPLA